MKFSSFSFLRRFLGLASYALLLGGFLTLSSCSHKPVVEEPPPSEKPAEPGKPKPLYEWYGDGVEGAKSVTIDIDKQKAFLYRNGKEVGWTTVATGIYSKPTPTGNFKVTEKTVDKRSNLWGKTYNSSGKVTNSDAKAGRDSIPEGGKFVGANMPYWMRLTGDGIGMHQGPIPRPGKRASHGCIRVHAGFVKRLFAFVDIGTPVAVIGDGPRWKPPVYKPTPKPQPAATTTPAAVAESTPTPSSEPAAPVVTPTPAPEAAPLLEVKPAVPPPPSE